MDKRLRVPQTKTKVKRNSPERQFTNQLIGKMIEITCLNGVKFNGVLKWCDIYTLGIENANGKIELHWKHSLASISESDSQK